MMSWGLYDSFVSPLMCTGACKAVQARVPSGQNMMPALAVVGGLASLFVNWPLDAGNGYPISGVTAETARREVLNDNGILRLTLDNVIGYCRDCRGNCGTQSFGNNQNCLNFLGTLGNLGVRTRFELIASGNNRCNWNFFLREGSQGPIWIQHHPEGHNFINPNVVTTPNHAYTTNTLPNMPNTAANPNPALNYNPHWHVRKFEWRGQYLLNLGNNHDNNDRIAGLKATLDKYAVDPTIDCNTQELSAIFDVGNDNNVPDQGLTGREVREHYFYDMTLG